MKKEYRRLGWLILNLALLTSSMLMTWFILGFEPPPALKPISGWEFILTRIATSITLSLKYGLSWLWVLSFLQGVGGIFVVCYVVVGIISINTKPKTHRRSKILSIILIVAAAVFLLSDFAFGSVRLPWPGYWLFLLGVLSSAIFEWQDPMVHNGTADM